MKPPVRLLDDPRLAAHLRADLEVFVHAPTPYDVARGAKALESVLADTRSAAAAANDGVHGVSTTMHALGTHGSAWSQLQTLPWTLKLFMLAAGVAAASLGAVVMQRAMQRAVQSAQASHRNAPTALHRPQAMPPGMEQPSLVRPVQDSSLAAIDDPAVARAEARVTNVPRSISASRREIAQLQRIHELLAQNPSAAYRVAQASQREFPHGPLHEEREGLRVLALWRLGQRRQAQQQAQQFLTRYPQSALHERMQRVVAGVADP